MYVSKHYSDFEAMQVKLSTVDVPKEREKRDPGISYLRPHIHCPFNSEIDLSSSRFLCLFQDPSASAISLNNTVVAVIPALTALELGVKQ